MAPKNLLRHPQAKSGLWEFDDIPDDKVRSKPLLVADTPLSLQQVTDKDRLLSAGP